MMCKWKIEIVLKCGKEIVGQVEDEWKKSMDVAKDMVTGNQADFYAIDSLDHKKQIFFRIGDVSSMAISVLEE